MKKPVLLFTLLSLASLLSSCTKIIPPTSVEFTLSDISSPIEIHTEKQLEFLTSGDSARYISNNYSSFARTSQSKPNKVNVSYTKVQNNDTAPTATYICVEDAKETYKFEVNGDKCDITNLKINTEYSYYVDLAYGDTHFKSEKKTFKTTGTAPRNLDIEGMENVRDLGGWNIGEDKTFKQGLIYRTAELNGADDGVSKPTEAGKRMLLDNLKIKTEIDLRKTVKTFHKDEVCGITSSPLGSSVKYVSCPMAFDSRNIFLNKDNTNSVKLFFEILAKEESYPLVFHCVRGTDRTGALAYAIGALCGMNEDDLMTDYLFSNFANLKSNAIQADNIKGLDKDNKKYYVEGINECEGETLSLKARNYIHDNVGVSIETLDKIIDILVD